jgi:Flp pilus assembly protein protease CpaA
MPGSNFDTADLVSWPTAKLARWWLLFAVVYGASVMTTATLRDAGVIALAGFALTVPPVALLAAVDITTKQLPRVISYATFAIALPLLSLDPQASGDGRWSAARGAMLMLAITASIRLLGRGVLGAVAGWFGAREVVASWLATALFGGFVAILIVLSGHSRRTRFAYGPLLLLGLCTSLLVAGG